MEVVLSEIDRINQMKVCVIVPTYNNCKTLKRVLDSVLLYTSNIIIVNDGSTDETARILENYTQHVQIHFPKNRGKGSALRAAFKKAIELDYNYAITIDSDGQHFASDLPKFIDLLEKEEDVLIIGSRDMMQKSVPKKSSFGNKFSNFWFRFETGIRLEDTQSGYRLYPLRQIPKKYFTNKFEFEIEVIVRSAWKGVNVVNMPIGVLYDPQERVTHFRPFTDFTRIGILNIVFVAIALVYIKPRDFFHTLKKKGIKRFLTENILQGNDSNLKKSLSIALGVFIGISPFWGFQTVTVLFLAVVLKLNKAISFTFSNISFPPMIPFIIYLSLRLGGNFIHSDSPLFLDKSITFTDIKNNIGQYIVGSFLLATITAVTLGVLSYILMTVFSDIKNKKTENL